MSTADPEEQEAALLAAPPLLEALCRSTAFVPANTFVPQDKTKYLSVKWLFAQDQLEQYAPHRHLIMAAVATKPSFETVANKEGVLIGVRLAKKSQTSAKKAKPILDISDPGLSEPVVKLTLNLLRNMRPTAKNSKKLAESGDAGHSSSGVAVFLVEALHGSLARPPYCRWAKMTVAEYTGVLRRSSLLVVLEGGFVQTKEYLAQFPAGRKLITQASSSQSYALTNATVNLLANICPTDANCDLVEWSDSGGGHKLMFKISAICQALPSTSRTSQASYVQFLKSTPKFTVVDNRLVHMADRLSKMPTEERLSDEISSLLIKCANGSSTLPLKELHGKLSSKAKLRVVTQRSLAHFIGRNGERFRVAEGAVCLNPAWTVEAKNSLDGQATIAKVPPVASAEMIAQRCTYLALCGKWAETESACTIDWLCYKLEGIPPRTTLTPHQLVTILEASHARFSLSEDRSSVSVVNDRIPECDAAVICRDMVGILEQHGSSLSWGQMLNAFNARRTDCIYLNKSLARQFVQDRPELFSLVGKEAVALVSSSKDSQSDTVPVSTESTIVQRSIFLILNGKWKTEAQTTCTIDWLQSKLAGMPPHLITEHDQLVKLFRKHRSIFIVSGDCKSVMIVNDSVLESDAAVICTDLVRVLEQNGGFLTVQKAIELFSTSRKDYIYLSIALVRKFIQDHAHFFRLDGDEVSLAGLGRPVRFSDVTAVPETATNDSLGEIDLDFLCPLDGDDDSKEEENHVQETFDQKEDRPPKSSGFAAKFKKFFHL